MVETPLSRHLYAKSLLLTHFPSLPEAFHALKGADEKLTPLNVIKQLYTQYQMSPSIAFELMSPFRGAKSVSLEEWVSVLEEIDSEAAQRSPMPADSPPDGQLEEEEAPEYSPDPAEALEDVREDLGATGQEMAFSRDSGSYLMSPPTYSVRKSLTDSLRDVPLSRAKSSALRDKQKWMELARNDFLGLNHGSQKSSLAQIFSDIDYELYPEDIECMVRTRQGLSEGNRAVLAEELKKMAQVNKALRRR